MSADHRKEPEEPRPCLEEDPIGTHGVLTSDEITYFATQHGMIDPFDAQRLKPAGYELALGSNYAKGGKRGQLLSEPGRDELEIPPFEVVIISTKETINLPRFLIARWNLRVEWVYQGLLWSGALQVDPGWDANLFCPIYNLSNEAVTLKLNQPIVLMDFVKTTPFKKGVTKEYRRPPKREALSDYHYEWKSALFTEARERLAVLDSKVHSMEEKSTEKFKEFSSKFDWFIGIVFTIIGLVIAAVSILYASADAVTTASPKWLFISPLLAFVAIVISLWSLRARKADTSSSYKITVTCMILSTAALLALVVVVLWLFA
jgi:deoxycytidine triphosphate deaminase